MSALQVRAAVVRAIGLGAGWWALTEGDWYGWPYGLVVVVLATTVSLRWLPPQRSLAPLPSRLLAGLQLAGWFLHRSFLGGLDVARRAASRPLDLRAGYVEYRFDLPPGMGRIVVAQILSLMPGTLAAGMDDHGVRIHVLDTGMDAERQIAELEQRVARVTGRGPTSGRPRRGADTSGPSDD